MRLIGVLMGFAESDRDTQSGLAALRDELRNLGWTEGRNVEMEVRWAGTSSAATSRVVGR
jgi:putative tryptophan/tyrosine transport system substrate-binding protein